MKSIILRISRVRRFSKKHFTKAKNFLSKARKKTLTYIDKKPYKSFFVVLGVFLLLIVISNILGSAHPQEKKLDTVPKQVQTYTIGSAPKLTVQAQIEKSGVVHITALTSGVVQAINKQVGQKVSKGQTLLRLSSNYQGGNISSLSRQLAESQYKNVTDTYDLNKDIIKKQKEIAQKVDVQSDELRSITDKSVGETNELIDLNNQILSSLDKNIAYLEATNVSGSNDALILSAKQLKSQFLAGNNSAKQAVRMAEFNSSGDKPPADISNLQKDLTLKQLDLQDKMLDLNREVSKIQLQIARVSEGMMFPSAPFSGTIQKVFVKVGQAVNPGTELIILSETVEKDPVIAIAYVSADIARKISKLETSAVHIDDKSSFDSHPSYITQDAIAGSLYGVYFDIPNQYVSAVTEKGFITVDLPIGYFDTGAAVPFIPIDAIYQTKAQSFVFVAENGKARAKSIELGEVFGSFVEITKGLSEKDMVIVNRNVIAGDAITTR